MDAANLACLDLRDSFLPDLHDVLRATASLQSLAYTVDIRRSPSVPARMPLRSLTCSTYFGVNLEPSPEDWDWQYLVRDLASLSTLQVERLCVLLEIYEDDSLGYSTSDEPPPPDEPFNALRDCLIAQDWAALETTLQSFHPPLKKLDIHLVMDKPWPDMTKKVMLANDIARARSIVLELGKSRLSEAVCDILDVTVDVGRS